MSSLNYLLVPGAGGSAWTWHLVEAELRRRGHKAWSVSLPADDDQAGLPEYTDAVVQAIERRNARDVVLVALSLAGFVAPLVCNRIPVALLVLLNAMIPNPGETPGDWWANTRHGEAKRKQNVRDGRAPDAAVDPLIDFFHDVPQSVIDEAWAQGEPRQSDSIFGSPCSFETWPAVPTRVLVARDDRFFPAEFQRRVARKRLGITPDEMPGGHLVALSRPAELAERLIAYGVARASN